MIRVKNGRLRWSETDVLTMARILGADFGAKQQAPIQHSILKAAAKKGIVLSPKAQRELESALAFHEQCEWDRIGYIADAPELRGSHAGYFPHQRGDLGYIRETKLPAYLVAHEPTVGKTNVAIGWSRFLQAERVLVICRNSAKEQWAREIKRWGYRPTPSDHSMGRGYYCPDVLQIVDGTIAEQSQQITELSSGWVIAHWEALVHARLAFLQRPWDLVIADEAHTARNRKAQRSETLFDLDAAHRLALSGSAYDGKDIGTLFSILHFLYPELYPSYWRFIGQHAHVTPQHFGGMIVGGARQPKLLRWEIAPFTLRRTIAEVRPNLPKIRRLRVTLHLTPKHEAEFKRIKKQFFAELEAEFGSTKTVVIPNAMARCTRLRQYLIDPGLLGGSLPSVKYPEVLAWIQELSGPPIIFTMFRQAAVRLTTFLSQHGITSGLIAGTKGRKKGANDKAQRRFLAGKLGALIVVTQAGGESLNLGKYGFGGLLDLPWRSRDVDQIEGRFNRPEEGTGITVPATAWRFIVADSYEEKMEANLNEGRKEYGKVFTLADLRDLFA